MKHTNDDALAYGAMMLFLYLAGSIMIVLAWGYVINIINDSAINPMIEDGKISVQTANATAYQANMIRYAPVPILLMGFIWGVSRGIFKRSTGG